MDEGLLDASKIPRFQFQIHNQELTNCIKQLHFHSKTQEKKIEKLKKDFQLKVNESTLSDLFIQMTQSIDIHPTLLKQLPKRNEIKQNENQLKNSSNKFGNKISQMSDLMRLICQKLKNVEKRFEFSQVQVKQQINEKALGLQNQLDQFKKSQNKQNRSLTESIMVTHNKYQEKLKEIQSKTLWQINDCKTKLNDRVNQQYVKDQAKEIELRIMNKIKETMIKTSIDPSLIDQLQIKSTKLQKQLQIKAVQLAARINELKSNMESNFAHRKEINEEKLDNQKKIGNLQVALADANRKIRNIDQEGKQNTEDIKQLTARHETSSLEIIKTAKLVANLKISDDFMKLMENLDPHKLCDIDTSLTALGERDLKIERQVDSLKRLLQKFREKVQICNLLAPGEQKAKLDKEQVNQVLIQLIASNATFKKIPSMEGQMHEFRAHTDLINEINKRISKIQKEFDIQSVVYGLRGLEEFLKKELLIMNTKLTQLESMFNQQKNRRPSSAKKMSDTKLSSSVSFKRLVPVDCISCFQNPIGERTPADRTNFLGKRS